MKQFLENILDGITYALVVLAIFLSVSMGMIIISVIYNNV